MTKRTKSNLLNALVIVCTLGLVLYYLGNGKTRAVPQTDVFKTETVTGSIPEKYRTFRYDTYDGYDRATEYEDMSPYDPEPDVYRDDDLSPYASIASQASGMGSGFGTNVESYAAEERELQQIFDFRSANIDTEVWFVALGSEVARQSGIKAFLRDHGSELGNAVFGEIDALGAGTLSLVSSEGRYKQQATQSRVKRFAHKAAQLMGKRVPETALDFQDSAASYAIANGYQAMHLVGIQNGKPALLAQNDDIFENVDEQTLYSNINYLVELLKNI